MKQPVAAGRWEVLKGLLLRIKAENPFQSQRLREISVADLHSFRDFSELVPCTTKQDLVRDQEIHPPDGSNRSAGGGRYIRFCQTSGTTGRPLRVWDTEESWDWLLQNWDRGYQWAGVEAGMAVYFAFSFGPFLGFWTAFESAARLGLRVIPGGGMSTRARVHAIREHGAEVLCCTPTYALHLAEVARTEGLSGPSPVCKIMVAGEPGGSILSVRQRLSEAWAGAEILDHYGMTETGPVAFAVGGGPSDLKVLEDRYYAEILEPGSNQPVLEGELGELVLTPLGRADWPLLRYRTGDLVRARRDRQGALWLEGGILGRVDDMRVVRGVNVYPSAVDALLRTVEGVGEYRVLISRKGAMTEVQLEVEGHAPLASAAERALERGLGLRVPVRPVAPGTLPRFEMKARRWVEC